MLCDKSKIIFIHLPKTGGTSIAIAMGKKQAEFKGKHWRPSRYYEELGAEKFKTYLKIAMVRNPWARMAAWYRFKLSRNHNVKSFDRFLSLNNVNSVPVCEKEFFQVQGNIPIDMFGRFESLETEFRRMTRARLPYREFPHEFNLGDRNYRSYYTSQKLIDMVAKKHKWVIDKFGYRFSDLEIK